MVTIIPLTSHGFISVSSSTELPLPFPFFDGIAKPIISRKSIPDVTLVFDE
jgi:hypothetical protein